MRETKAPQATPSPDKNLAQTPNQDGGDKSPSAVFVSMALDMTWRLAIVVLGPIIGGFYADKALKTSPVFFILGLVLAMAGMGLVMRRTLQAANRVPAPNVPKNNEPKENHS